MKRLLLVGVLGVAVLIPAAGAAPAATGARTIRGTVIAKDRAHHALVVARAGGSVQLLVAPTALARVGIGRTVVARTTTAPGRLPVAVSVSVREQAHRATFRGTVVRLARRQAVLSAGGTFLRITLKPQSGARKLSSARSGPGVGDDVRVRVEIDDDGTLDGGVVVVTDDVAEHDDGAGELEVRGTVTALAPSTATVAGSITLTARGLPVTCAIPAGAALTVKVGDLVELECDLVGDPGVWTVHVAKDEDEHAAPGRDDVTEVEVRGTIAAPFLQTSTAVTVTPASGGASVTCTVPAGSLAHFAAGDLVKMECVRVGDTLKLREIEKTGDDVGGVSHGGDSGHGGDDDGHHGGGGGGPGKD